MTLKTETLNEKRQQEQEFAAQPLLEEFAPLFYIGKVLGINPQDYDEFRKYKHFEKSQTGDCYAITWLIMVCINFNLMVWVFHDPEYSVEKDNLTVAIGYILTYFSLFIYLVDRIAGLVNQNQFIDIFETLQELEVEFLELGIQFNNHFIRYHIVCFIALIVVSEASVFIFTFAFLVDRDSWSAWLWTFTAVPTFCNSLDKIWYNVIFMVIKKRFEAINREFDSISGKLKQEKAMKNTKNNPIISTDKGKTWNNLPRKTKIQPASANSDRSNYLGEVVCHPQLFSFSLATVERMAPPPRASTLPFEMLQERFVKLCQLHNELCDVGGTLNEVWGYPNLILMGYGFFIVTAQLYFYYCSSENQSIPSLFRPASNIFITIIYLLYVSVKCISVLNMNYTINLEAKKTGVCMHRCALAADKNKVYEMVNHLSLKLFNHVASFSACGYFPLDMETLFGFCGGISTYLIILIQFNIEQQQVKSAKTSYSKDNDTLTEALVANVSSILSEFYQIGTDITTNALQ